MSDTVIVALASLVGTGIGSYSGFKLMKYRVEQLEKKVEKHNSLIERTYKLEQEMEIQKEKMTEANHRISDLEGAK